MKTMKKAKMPSKKALATANVMTKLFDELQTDWTAVVVVLRRAKP